MKEGAPVTPQCRSPRSNRQDALHCKRITSDYSTAQLPHEPLIVPLRLVIFNICRGCLLCMSWR